ncbi:MAG: glutathione peroxidase [Burkholderiaceae bacterium]|jgi:glutathione peroxidase
MTTVYDFSADTLSGAPQPLSDFKGKVLLIVNTASQCGFTPQYKGLEELYEKYHDQGLEILGFPCNQFGSQEPGSAEQIAQFCESKFGVRFPMFAKIEVNGSNAHPLYAYLKSEAPGILGLKDIKWNFTKFLVRRDGTVADRYAPTTTPGSLEKDVVEALGSA